MCTLGHTHTYTYTHTHIHIHTHTHTHTHTQKETWKLAPRPRSKQEKQTAGNAWETWTVAAADGVGCALVRWEINFLFTFETAPFFYVYPVLHNVVGKAASFHQLPSWEGFPILTSLICTKNNRQPCNALHLSFSFCFNNERTKVPAKIHLSKRNV